MTIQSRVIQVFCGYAMFCEQCGMVQVLVPPEHIGAWLRFCSDACQLKAQTARQKEQRHAKREVRRCEYCAEEFEPTRADAKTCSSACRVALHRLKRAG